MTDIPRPADGYEISTDPARIDAARVHRWLSTDAYWALGRPRETQDRAIAGSLNFGVFDTARGEQVGYARVVTDLTTFAWLCDVYVDPAVRGKGLGSALVAAVREHLRPLGVRRIVLATDDAHGVYEKLGFRPLERPGQWMALALG
ncbi:MULTISPECIES: GNAT family N-acetyltransferase [unclassified Streptomyces]|uniref:GNAT family N-acetyltransferase n=1 Tax=unclassified Streptomyces TaxID=2593676 RepID=UPI0007DDDE93|nr:GNAT family N-acetyltransferase [Streptomyces sp. SAT1]ANH90681.1 acetyltransferase [Streptomyces sp. SAT1]